MTGRAERFPAAWLHLREPFDHAARDPGLVRRLGEALGARPVVIADLGCGLGSNLRFTAPRLDRPQRWLLVDRDRALLDAAAEALEAWARGLGWPVSQAGAALRLGARIEAELVAVDLGPDLASWSALAEADAVTTQALLDLVDAPWIDALVAAVADRPLLAALTVDGRVGWHPSDPDDGYVAEAFRVHQRRGKPGPSAAAWLAGRLVGHDVAITESDWRIVPGDPAFEPMIAAMIDGTAAAAASCADPGRASRWRDRRRAAPPGLRVGHVDLLALPGPRDTSAGRRSGPR